MEHFGNVHSAHPHRSATSLSAGRAVIWICYLFVFLSVAMSNLNYLPSSYLMPNCFWSLCFMDLSFWCLSAVLVCFTLVDSPLFHLGQSDVIHMCIKITTHFIALSRECMLRYISLLFTITVWNLRGLFYLSKNTIHLFKCMEYYFRRLRFYRYSFNCLDLTGQGHNALTKGYKFSRQKHYSVPYAGIIESWNSN